MPSVTLAGRMSARIGPARLTDDALGTWLALPRGMTDSGIDDLAVTLARSWIQGPIAAQGLSTTHEAIEQLGGRIWLESIEGVGSTFYFAFPESPDLPVGPHGTDLTSRE